MNRVEIIVVGRESVKEILGVIPDGSGPWYLIRAVCDDGRSAILIGPVETLTEVRHALHEVFPGRLPATLVRELLSRIDILEERQRISSRSTESRLVVLSSIAGGVAGVASFALSLFEHIANRPSAEPKSVDRHAEAELPHSNSGLVSGQTIEAGTLYRRIPPLPAFWNRRTSKPTHLAFKPLSNDGLSIYMNLAQFVPLDKLPRYASGYGLGAVDIQTFLAEQNLLVNIGAIDSRAEVVYLPNATSPGRVVVENVTLPIQQLLARVATTIWPQRPGPAN